MICQFVRIYESVKIRREGGATMNSQQLSSQAHDLEARAVSNRKEAERFTYNAQAYRNNGDDSKAEIDEQRAQRLITDAEGYEREATQLTEASLDQEARAQQLDAEKQRIQAEYDNKLAEIDKERQKLVG